MRHHFLHLFLAFLALSMISCSEKVDPDGHGLKMTVSSFESDKTESIDVRECLVYVDFTEHDSMFSLTAGGSKPSDSYMLSISFPHINTLDVGSAIDISNFYFTNPHVSAKWGSTNDYEGSVSLKEKTEEQAVLVFNRITCSILGKVFIFDGEARCDLVKIPYHAS